jgi:hypothetical protein
VHPPVAAKSGERVVNQQSLLHEFYMVSLGRSYQKLLVANRSASQISHTR